MQEPLLQLSRLSRQRSTYRIDIESSFFATNSESTAAGVAIVCGSAPTDRRDSCFESLAIYQCIQRRRHVRTVTALHLPIPFCKWNKGIHRRPHWRTRLNRGPFYRWNVCSLAICDFFFNWNCSLSEIYEVTGQEAYIEYRNCIHQLIFRIAFTTTAFCTR